MQDWLINANACFAKERAQLHILTPCYGGMVNTTFVACFLRTQELLSELGVSVKLELLPNESLITRARNTLVAKAMSDARMTHVIFIDSDIVWEPHDVVKLLMSGKDVVGGVYPKKGYLWDALKEDSMQNIKQMVPPDMDPLVFLRTHLVSYNWNLNNASNYVENGCMEVKHLATGFLMITRHAFLTLMKQHPETKYTDDVGHLIGEQNAFAYSLFDCAIVEDHYYSEDWLFCKRWTDAGGKVYADITIPLIHIGPEAYLGKVQSIFQFSDVTSNAPST